MKPEMNFRLSIQIMSSLQIERIRRIPEMRDRKRVNGFPKQTQSKIDQILTHNHSYTIQL